MAEIDPVTLTQDLVRCPSVTPLDEGALGILQSALEPLGFVCERLVFQEPGTEPVDNLYARWGTSGPTIGFAGHTDVVPVGDEGAWSHRPFNADIADGLLYGRGAADMKSGIAAFVAAAARLIERAPPDGSIALIITGDEEALAVNGTVKMVDWMQARGERVDFCLVGEPSSTERLGDAIKIGRRGSMNARLAVEGIQGHSAYPHLADNAASRMVRLLGAIVDEPLDEGSEHYEPSNLAITSIDIGNKATNIIPGRAEAAINVRFNDHHSGASVQKWLTDRFETVDDRFSLSCRISGEPFFTPPGQYTELVANAVSDIVGQRPHFSTGGGTSDGRFIKDICPVIELGVINASIHKVDEHVATADIVGLSRIYERALERFFEAA